MDRPKISVILPIYNVEPYIEECLDSILDQTMLDDLEVIMVDDESSDNSRYTIERYTLDHDNFHAYHKKNEGSGIARNYGLEMAKGEYVHFFDPDDYIKPDFYEKMYEFAKSCPNADFVVGNSTRYGVFNIWESVLYKNSIEKIDKPIASTNIREIVDLVWDTGVWNKLIKKEFLDEKNIRFPNENIVSQDLVFTIKLHYLADKIAINPDIYYYWRLRQSKNSVTQQKGKIKSFTDRLRVIELIREFFKENDVEEEILYAEYSKWLNHDLKDYIKKIKEFPEEYHEEKLLEVKNILKDIPESIKKNLNSYKQIIYKMIENDDYEGLLSFSCLEDDLKKNPKLFEIAGEDYEQYVNLIRDGEKEELKAMKEDLNSNDEEILIDFFSYLPYVDGENFEISAAIVDNKNKKYPVVIEDMVDAIKEEEEKDKNSEDCSIVTKKRLIIPLDLIKDLEHSRIRIKYESENLSKETFLKNNRRKTFVYDNFDVDVGIGVQKELFIDIREKNDVKIRIKTIVKDDEKFILIGSCEEKIENLKIKNIVNFNEKVFPLQYLSTSEINDHYYEYLKKDVNENEFNEGVEEYEHKFITELPFKELFNDVIKKWEIGSDEIIDNVKLSKNFYFYTSTHKIQIRNMRNKIVLEIFVIDNVSELHAEKEENIEMNEKNKELKNEIKELKKERKALNKEMKKLEKNIRKLNEDNKKLDENNKKLHKANKKQKELIEEYKNRKVVKIVDSIKNIHN